VRAGSVWLVVGTAVVVLDILLALGVRAAVVPSDTLVSTGYLLCFVAGVGVGRLRARERQTWAAIRSGSVAGMLVGAVSGLVSPVLLAVLASRHDATGGLLGLLLGGAIAACTGAIVGGLGALLGVGVRRAVNPSD
jgi:lipid-binding SYLF domain-containing protein